MMQGLMRDMRKEQEFLGIFDTHADEFFSYCVSRIPDPAQAQEVIEKTFKRGWDQIAAGKSIQIEQFYRLLDESVDARTNQGLINLSRFFGSFRQRVPSS